MLDFGTELPEVDVAIRGRTDDAVVHLVVETGHGEGDKVDAYVVSKKDQVVVVEQDACGLHLDPLERVLEHALHHAEVGQELAVLLGFGRAGKHDGVTAVVSGECQAFHVVVDL